MPFSSGGECAPLGKVGLVDRCPRGTLDCYGGTATSPERGELDEFTHPSSNAFGYKALGVMPQRVVCIAEYWYVTRI